MVHGVPPHCGFSPQTSQPKVDPKCGTTLLSHGRWWEAWLHTFLLQLQRIFCNSIFGGGPRSLLWHYHGWGMHLVHERIKVLQGYLGPCEICLPELGGCQSYILPWRDYHEFWFKLIEFYGPFQDRMLNQQSAQLTSQDWNLAMVLVSLVLSHEYYP